MTTLKIQQKLNKDEFTEMVGQAKKGFVFIVKEVNKETGEKGAMWGRVHDAFNLGKKIEARVAMGCEPQGEFRFRKNEGGIWMLINSDAKK